MRGCQVLPKKSIVTRQLVTKRTLGYFSSRLFLKTKNIDCGSFLYEMLIALTNSLESIEKKLAWKAQNPIYYFQKKKGHWYAERSLELSSKENP